MRKKDRIPKNLEIEVTNFCNLKCKTCRRGRKDFVQEPFQQMTLDEFEIIIGRFPILEKLQFCGEAENTLNSSLPEMIEHAHRNGVKWIEMFTNGTTLNENLASKLSNTHLDMVKFSIDGTREKTYQDLRGAKLKRVVENAKRFVEISGKKAGVEMVISKPNLDELHEAPAMAKYIGASVLELRVLSWVSEDFNELSVDHKEIVDLLKKISDDCKKKRITLDYVSPEEAKDQDCLVEDWINIDSKGNLTFCYYRDKDLIGNLLTTSLEDIWYQKDLTDARERFRNKDYDPECCCPAALYLEG